MTKIQKLLSIVFVQLFLTTALWGSVGLYQIEMDGKISIEAKNRSVKSILDMIEKEGTYRFMYDNNLSDMNKQVSVNVDDVEILSLLDEIFKGTNLTTQSMENNLVVITTKENVGSTAKVAQEKITVTGKITDAKTGEPLAFVSILDTESNSNYTSTDFDGNYTITVSPKSSLQVMLIGYSSLEVLINNRAIVDIALESEATALDEILVVAYGTAKKGTYTGSVATVGAEQFDSRPLTEVTRGLVGAAAGMVVGTSSGQPGSDPTIRIRGLGSFNASNSPLVVLDGMPYDNSLTNINPNDIESVSILKDASSSALYGSRAANGVLLITTKKGKKGEVRVNAKYNLGLTTRQTADYETAGLTDYMELYWESRRNNLLAGGATMEEAGLQAGHSLIAGMSYNAFNMDPGELFDPVTGKLNPNAQLLWADDLDWRSALQRTGIRHDATVTISGGSEKTDYYTSIGFLNNEGYVIGSSYMRYSAKANVNTQLNRWLKVGSNLNVSIAERHGEQTTASGNNSNAFRFLRNVGNIFPIHMHDPVTGDYLLDSEGNKLYDFGLGYTHTDGTVVPQRDYVAGNNPALELQNIYNGRRRNNINFKTYAEITFLKDFKLSLNIGLGENMLSSWSGSYVYPEKGNAGTSTKTHSNTTVWTINQLLTYNKEIGKHHVDVLVGHESYSWRYKYLTSSMKGQIILGDNFEFRNFSEINSIPNAYINEYNVEGYLSRVNYDYDDKYFASFSYRRDGTSRFHRDARWGNFWSFGAGWRIDREKFMEDVAFVNMLKFRASYGIVGNDDLDSYYPWRATYTPNPNDQEPGYIQGALGNSELSWEVSRNLDIALEFSLFGSTLDGVIEVFNRESSNLLFEVPQPLSSGVDAQSINAGTMYNRGLELTADYVLLRRNNLTWRVNGNATFLKNKIVDLPLDPYKSSVYRIEEGHPRYEFWLRQWYGVNPETGYNLYVADIENESYVWGPDELIEINGIQYTEQIEHAKWDWSGIATPKVTGAFGTNLQYKNWTLGINFYYQLGGIYYDGTYRSLMEVGAASLSYSKLHKDLVNRWKAPGDVTDIPRLSSGNDAENLSAASSTRWLTTSNMFEITNININYRIPKRALQKIGIRDMSVYMSADNPLLLTARRGMFPRRNTFSGYTSNSDVYLPDKTVSFGVNINF